MFCFVVVFSSFFFFFLNINYGHAHDNDAHDLFEELGQEMRVQTHTLNERLRRECVWTSIV
jgi:hypothetical protein